MQTEFNTVKPHESDGRISENLPQLAAEAFRLSRRLCGTCQNYHSLWTYQRIAGASGGDVGAPEVSAVLGRLLSFPGREILIAGSADTGLLAVVLGFVQADCRVVVLDQCETPLELCRRFSSRTAHEIVTLRSNLVDMPVEARFDVVLAHSLLQYIGVQHRLEVLSRMRRALRPDGSLVLVFRTSARIEGALLQEYREGYSTRVIEQLDVLNVPLPEPREAFRRQVEIYAEERRAREGAHTSLQEVEELIGAAGFKIQELCAIGAAQTEPFRELGTKISKKRFLMVASPAR